MNIVFFIFITIALQIVCLYAAKKSSKNLGNQEDYFLAGKKLKFFPLAMTFVATQIGGGLILGSAEEAYRVGWTALLYPLGCIVGLILLGLGIGKRLARFKVSTVAQIFEVVYGSAALKKVASLLSIISLFIIVISQVIASNKFMLSLGVDNQLLFFAFWGIVIFYTSFGGLKAVVATDVVQAFFFIIVFVICISYIVATSDVSMGQVFNSQLEEIGADVSTSQLYGWLLMPLLFMLIEQDMAQRCFSALNDKIVSKATLSAGLIILLVTAFPIYLGVLAKEMAIIPIGNASILMTVIQKTSTPLLSALMGAAILVAIISTADSLLNAISSNISQDFEKIRKYSVSFSQKLTLGIALLAIFSSFYFDQILGLLLVSYELSVSCLFVPIFIALFKPRGNKESAWLAIVAGGLGFIIFRFVWVDLPREVLSVLLSLLGFILGEIYCYIKLRSHKVEESITKNQIN